MGSILKLPCIRFVRQVSNGVSLSKYGYIGMMERNAQAIQSAAWRKAACRIDEVALTVNKVTETDGEWDAEGGKWLNRPTYSAWLQDRFDCFIQGGDAVKELGTFCGYAGMVAYRFTLPTVNPGSIDEIKLLIQRDRYLRAGVRVAVEINDSASPSNDWQVLRGENDGAIASPSSPSGGVVGVASWGFLHQYDVPFLMASRAWEGTLELTRDSFPGLGAAASGKYLWVYMSPEDFCGYWDMYDAKEQRYYSIEGSAAVLSGSCSFTFETDAVAPESGEEPVESVTWGRSVLTDNPPSVPVNMVLDVDGGDKRAMRTFGELAVCGGVSAVMTPYLDSSLAGSVWSILGAGGSLLFDTFNRGKAEISRDFGSVDSYVSPTEMNRLSGVPMMYSGGLFFLLRSCGAEANREPFENGYRVVAKTQMFLGAAFAMPPTDKAEYSRFRILDEKLATLNGCKMSLNIWKSSSRDFFGGFSVAALQSLMCNPAIFTGAENSISGTVSASLWPASKDRGDGSHECDGEAEAVSVSVTAELIANVPIDSAYAADGKMAVDVTGVKILPGDIVIIAPKVESVNVDTSGYSAYWGIGGDSVNNTVGGGFGMSPVIQFG